MPGAYNSPCTNMLTKQQVPTSPTAFTTLSLPKSHRSKHSMNPYDFVPIDRQHPPERRRPVWHNALAPDTAHPGKLYSGYLYLYIRAETPLFIPDTNTRDQDPGV